MLGRQRLRPAGIGRQDRAGHAGDRKRSLLGPRIRRCLHIGALLLEGLQWYLGEGAEELTHGLGQALQKRGKPRRIMMENGSAIKAGETRQGLLEDESRIRTDHGTENIALLRKVAMNLAKSDRSRKRGIQAKRTLACWNEAYLLKLLQAGLPGNQAD